MIDFLCFLIALILLVLAAFGIPSSRITLGWLGMAFFVLAFFLHSVQALGLH
jgi:hypothetical protein